MAELTDDPSQTAEDTPLAEGADAHSPPDSDDAWHPLQRILFRFGFLYFFLYTAPIAIAMLPFFGRYLGAVFFPLQNRVLVWVGREVLRLDYQFPSGFSGSGDKTVDFIQLLVTFALALGGCLLWTLIDRRRLHYRSLARWLSVACRYFLAFEMLTYGFAKVFPGQFLFPRLSWLIQPLGEASPMRLVWAFMGYSKAYTIFAGLGEVVGGMLLFFRRTTTLGALVVVGVMANVVMINFSYDVPVKLFSSHLLLMACLLLLPDARRLLSFFVLNRPVPAVRRTPHFTRPWARRTALAVKVLVIGFLLFQYIAGGLANERRYGPSAPKPPLYGLYEVDGFTLDGVERPPLLTDAERWRRVIIDGFRGVQLTVQMMDGQMTGFGLEIDEDTRTLTLQRGEEEHAWSFRETPPTELTLEGELDGRPYVVTLRRRDPDDFLLVRRGFRWVNERPYNRAEPLPKR